MGNSNTSYLPSYHCFDENISRNSVTPEYWESDRISEDFKASTTAAAVLTLLFMLIGLPGNALIMVSIIQQRLYKETTHILLFNLAISDFLVCLLVMPFTVAAGFAGGYIFGDSDYSRCQVCQSGAILLILTLFSINILCLISVDRFIFIKFPLRYKQWMTIPRVIVIIVLMWLFSILAGILPIIGFGENKYAYSHATCTVSLRGQSLYYGILLVIVALVPIAMIVATNIWTACIVKKQIMKVYRTRRSFTNKEDLKKYNESLRKKIHKKRNRKQFALMRAFGGILISNLIVWMPIIIHIFVSSIIDSNLIPLGMFVFAFVAFISHTVIHPFIEGCFIPELKFTLKKMLGIYYCKKQIERQKETFALNTSDLSDLESYDKEGCCRTCRNNIDLVLSGE